jgi:hypothetical protein
MSTMSALIEKLEELAASLDAQAKQAAADSMFETGARLRNQAAGVRLSIDLAKKEVAHV